MPVTWMDLEMVTPSEAKPIKKDKYPMHPFFLGLCTLLTSVIGIFLPLWKIPSHYSFLSCLFSVSFPVCDARPGPSLAFSSFPIRPSLWSVTSTLWPSSLRLEGLFFPACSSSARPSALPSAPVIHHLSSQLQCLDFLVPRAPSTALYRCLFSAKILLVIDFLAQLFLL